MKVSMKKCKKKLAVLWFSGASILLAIFILQTNFGHYGDKAKEAWSWLLPSILPTLSLIIIVLVMDTLGKGVKTENVDRFMFRLSFYLSFAYLSIIFLIILTQPFASMTPLELMNQSNIYLGPFQGLVSASLGAFYVKT